MNVFQLVKANVTARQAAEAYGLKVNQHGMACCPFHQDKTPSMKLDDRYYCFGCGVTGDAVDLTMQLLGLPAKDAALRLASDFGIPIDADMKRPVRPRLSPKARPRADPEAELTGWAEHAVKILIEYRWLLRDWEKEYAPQRMDDDWHPLFCEALQRKTYIDHLLDELDQCSKDQFREMKNCCGKEVEEIGKRLERYVGGDAGEDRSTQGQPGAEQEGRGLLDQGQLCASLPGGSVAQRSNPSEPPDRAKGDSEESRLAKGQRADL